MTIQITTFNGTNYYTLIPFSLCGITYWLSIYAVAFKKHELFKYTSIMSIGAFSAWLVPNHSGLEGIFTLESFRFYISHGMIVMSQLFMYQVYGFRYRKNEYKKALYFIFSSSLLMMLLNYKLSTNFYFLAKPTSGVFLGNKLGPWPYYLIWFMLITILVAYLFEKSLLKYQERNHG